MPISLGDITFVGINTSGTDWFAFAALNDIAAGTVLYFTDNELASASATSFNSGESYLKWVAPAGGVAAGTVVNFSQLPASPTSGTTTGTVSTGTFTAIGNFATSQNTGISNGQDTLFAYAAASDASADTPTEIVAMVGIGNAPDIVPTALTGANAKFAVVFNSTSDSAYFSGTHTGQPTLADYAALIGNTANWTLGANETANATLNTAPFVATPPASLSVNSPSIAEGNSGTKLLTFTVTLSSAASQTVSVDYATADGTATVAGLDYAAASGTLTFYPGELTKTVTVTINGDQAIEPNETLSLVLSSPVNATIAAATGTGTLTNDDVTLTGDDHFTVAAGDTAIASATPITWDVTTGAAAGGVVVTNAGTIQSTASVAISAPAAAAATAASLTVQNTGQIQGATGAILVAAGLNGGTLGLSNTGTIDGGTGRAINVTAYSGAETISLYNDATGIIQSANDVLRVTGSGAFAGVVDVDNWGTIHATAGGQGIDLADLAPTAAGQLYVTNEEGASILADDNDGLRTGAFTNVQNFGLIKGASAGNTGADGIDAQSNAGVTVTNYAGATIQGARHGITGSAPIAVTNFGTIQADAGSGINMDTVGSSVMTVVNEVGGVITGTAALGKDGDGVDIDGQVDISNRGTIQALGQTPGENNEALAIGGGTVTNWGTISSVERAIKVDDSDNGNAHAALNLTNHGTITAGTLEAILTIGNFGNTIVNDGTINGDIVTDSGNDTVTNTGTLNGNVSTGAGNDTVAAGSGNQLIDAGAGDDQIDGGADDDTARFSGTIAAATLSRLGSTIIVTSADGIDHLTNVESLQFADGTIIASSINTGPVLSGAQATLAHGTEDTAYTVTLGDLLAGFSDAEGDALAVTGLTSNHGSVVDNGDGTFTITPTANYFGSATLSYTVTDGLGGTAAASLGYVIDEVADTQTGTNGNDNLTGTAGSDVLIGLLGNDRLDGGAGNDTASYAGAGPVAVDLRLALPQATGGAGRDTLISIENLIGSSNNDRLTGDNNANTLDGGNGVDKLYGVGGNDHLLGGAGNDLLDGGSGADILDGGIGNDIYYVDNLGDVVIEGAAGGTDTVYSDVNFTLSDNVEKLYLTSGQSKIGIGNALANTIQASDASATLSGLAGNDTIKGAAGADTLTGGFGKDMLTGGAGADTFVFDVFETSANKDTITDFVAGTDKIALSVSAYTGLAGYGLGALDNGELAIGPAANVPGQHLIYNNVNGALYYDADGFGGTAQVQIATISGHPALTASDFILI